MTFFVDSVYIFNNIDFFDKFIINTKTI